MKTNAFWPRASLHVTDTTNCHRISIPKSVKIPSCAPSCPPLCQYPYTLYIYGTAISITNQHSLLNRINYNQASKRCNTT